MEAGEDGKAVRYCQSWPHRFSNRTVKVRPNDGSSGLVARRSNHDSVMGTMASPVV